MVFEVRAHWCDEYIVNRRGLVGWSHLDAEQVLLLGPGSEYVLHEKKNTVKKISCI